MPLHDPDQVRAEACRLLNEHLGSDRVSLAGPDEDGQPVVVSEHRRDGAPVVTGRFALGGFGVGPMTELRAGRTLVMRDIAREPGLSEAARRACAMFGIGACLAAPVVRNGRLLSVLSAQAGAPRDWTAAEIAVTQEAADRAWFAAERARVEAELRTNEARFRTLVEGIPQIVWRAAELGDWSYASPQWTAYTGQPEAESLGLGWLACVHPEDRGAAVRNWSEAPPLGAYVADYRLRCLAEGRYRWVQTRAAPVRDGGGNVVEWLGTSTDVDEMRRSEEQRAATAREFRRNARDLVALFRTVTERAGRAAVSVDDLRRSLDARLGALARAQDLIADEAETISFGALLRGELEALDPAPTAEQAVLDGPEVAVPAGAVPALALALHELVVGARRHGALALPHGGLHVTWRLTGTDAAPHLVLDWMEKGGGRRQADRDPVGRALGQEMIEKVLPEALLARTTYRHDAEGLRCGIEFPLLPAALSPAAPPAP